VIADFCANSVHRNEASTDIGCAVTTLIATLEKLRELGREVEWYSLSPVIHNLDWQLRMLPQQSPEATCRAHAQAYASAGRVLRNTNAIKRDKEAENWAVENRETRNRSARSELNEWIGVAAKGRKEGGQVPQSVRIQAPARQRGSVSP
jgi:hypothetical protein